MQMIEVDKLWECSCLLSKKPVDGYTMKMANKKIVKLEGLVKRAKLNGDLQIEHNKNGMMTFIHPFI